MARKRRTKPRPQKNGHPATGSAGRGLLKEVAYAQLKQRILGGEFTPGSCLSERQVALDLSMSKTPIRAAVERLQQEGFVTISPQQGIVVRDLSVHEIADQYEVRLALETFVVRTLAGRLSPPQAERLRANLDAQRDNCAGLDIARSVELDTEFHMLFCEFLGNQEILRVMKHLRERIHRVITRVNHQNVGRIASSYQEHHAIVDAVLSGDAPGAARRMEEHLDYGKRVLLSPWGR
jgi:DNA-binding GntR family transcriptional regulator